VLTLQVPVVLDVDLVPTDRNFIWPYEDAAAGRSTAARDPRRTPLEERVAAGTALLLRCHDKRAHRFEFSLRTDTATRRTSFPLPLPLPPSLAVV
jgi:hypothetical protein